MLHTNVSQSATKRFPVLNENDTRVPGPVLLANRKVAIPGGRRSSAAFAELAVIASRRCSSFFAEAAALVLVFGILDFFLLKGHVDLGWVAGALAVSLGLLAASIATDFTAQRWIKAHP